MNIFVVMKGEMNEGGVIRGAFTTKKKAVTWIEDNFQDFFRNEGEDSWICGADWITVQRVKVQ